MIIIMAVYFYCSIFESRSLRVISSEHPGIGFLVMSDVVILCHVLCDSWHMSCIA
jgi:hypothetical protein